MKSFFTSDHHFFHHNIIKYCGRPFSSVEEMNAEMTRRWRDVVGDDDTVYYLGDMFMGKRDSWREIREQLTGKIHFVIGNHDRKKALLEMDFEEVVSDKVLNLVYNGATKKILLRHRPQFERAPKFDFHLCGHVHEKWRRKGNIVNVGVDVWNFTPQRLDDLLQTESD